MRTGGEGGGGDAMLSSPLDTGVYRFVRAWFPLFSRLAFGMKVSGTEHVPASGAVVIASNHLSNLDPFFVGSACPRQIHWMAKSELWKSRLLGRAVESLGAFPVRRGEADRESVRAGLDILDKGAVLGIFPEGHRQRSGRLGQPAPGVGLFSSRPGVVTVPVVITGTNRFSGPNRSLFPRISVTFGPPIDVDVPEVTKSERNRVVSRRIMSALAVLLREDWEPLEDGQ